MKYVPDRVLIVDSSKSISDLITRKLQENLNYEVITAKSLKEAKSVLLEEEDEFSVALLNLALPDDPEGDLVDYVLGKGIPTIVMTEAVDDKVRDKILSKNVMDYILKTGKHFIDTILKIFVRLALNRATKILVVDDSVNSRSQITALLKQQQLQVFEAESGVEAFEVLKEAGDFQMIIADCHNHKMSGVELVTRIRQLYSPEQLAFIGISSQRSTILSAQILKHGATDFVIRPFSSEEFLYRINQNLEIFEYRKQIKELATRDQLTGLYNRRYISEIGDKLYHSAKREHLNLTICMLDIDHFKRINDNYDHKTGDIVLKSLSRILKGHFRNSDVIARYGGEEFLILATNLNLGNCQAHFEKLRGEVESISVRAHGDTLKFTVSMGVTNRLNDNFEDMINRAEELLFQAKRTGRNQIIFDSGCSKLE